MGDCNLGGFLLNVPGVCTVPVTEKNNRYENPSKAILSINHHTGNFERYLSFNPEK